MVRKTFKTSFLLRYERRFFRAALTVPLTPAHLIEEPPQSRQLSAIEAGDDIVLRFAPVGQSAQEDRLASLRQCRFALTQILARGKCEQPAPAQNLDITRDSCRIAI
jgi:hypothetical protein